MRFILCLFVSIVTFFGFAQAVKLTDFRLISTHGSFQFYELNFDPNYRDPDYHEYYVFRKDDSELAEAIAIFNGYNVVTWNDQKEKLILTRVNQGDNRPDQGVFNLSTATYIIEPGDQEILFDWKNRHLLVNRLWPNKEAYISDLEGKKISQKTFTHLRPFSLGYVDDENPNLILSPSGETRIDLEAKIIAEIKEGIFIVEDDDGMNLRNIKKEVLLKQSYDKIYENKLQEGRFLIESDGYVAPLLQLENETWEVPLSARYSHVLELSSDLAQNLKHATFYVIEDGKGLILNHKGKALITLDDAPLARYIWSEDGNFIEIISKYSSEMFHVYTISGKALLTDTDYYRGYRAYLDGQNDYVVYYTESGETCYLIETKTNKKVKLSSDEFEKIENLDAVKALFIQNKK